MTDRKLNILFLSPWYPHRYDPMFGLFVERHALAAARFHRICTLYCHADERLRPGVWETDRQEEGNYTAWRIYYPKSKTGVRPWDALVNGLRYFRAHRIGMKKLHEENFRPDLVHVHILTRAGMVALRLKRKLGIPYLITEHWSRYQPGKAGYDGWLRRRMTRKVVRQASMVTTVTNNLARAMQAHQLLHPDYRIIYNVVDTALFAPVTPAPRAKHRIVHISCFEEKSKNLSGIVKAIAALSHQRTDFVLDMVGEGHDREATLQLAKELGMLDTFIRFPGLMEGKALADTLADADFLIVFSHYENLPVVINEAMACGLPVVSSDVGGIREVLTRDKGILVPPGDEPAFVDALNTMLDTHTGYNRAAIRAFAELHFSQEAVGRFLDQVYQQVNAGHGR